MFGLRRYEYFEEKPIIVDVIMTVQHNKKFKNRLRKIFSIKKEKLIKSLSGNNFFIDKLSKLTIIVNIYYLKRNIMNNYRELYYFECPSKHTIQKQVEKDFLNQKRKKNSRARW